MQQIALAPVARRDLSGGAFAGVVVGLLVAALVAALVWRPLPYLPLPAPAGTGPGWHVSKFLLMHLMPESESAHTYSSVLTAHAEHGYLHLIYTRLAVILAAGLAVGGLVFWSIAGRPVRAEIHHNGPRLLDVSAARKIMKEETGKSEKLFSVAGLDFTLDRIRRSFLILGSIGGGKTQAIWTILRGLIGSGFKILIVDGPKGDYSVSVPGKPLIIAPWHAGPAWDIARDCPTRGHARELASVLIPVSESEPLWGNAAGMIFVAVICKLQVEKKLNWGWYDLSELLALPISDLKDIAAMYYPPAVQAVNDAESKTTQSLIINLTSFMGDVYEMSLAWKNTKSKFSFINWWQNNKSRIQVVIIQGSGEYKGLAGGYITGILQSLAKLTASPSFPESKTRKNIIICDEFAQLPKMPGFEKFFEIGRSKGCSAIIATQSPAQVRKIWGHDDMQAWLAMIGTKIYTRILGHDDAEIAINELGEKEIYVPTQTISNTVNGQSISNGFTLEKSPVISQGQLKELGPKKKGLDVFISGFGQDVLKACFKYTKTEILREAIIPNPDFNAHIVIALTENNVIAASGNAFLEIEQQIKNTKIQQSVNNVYTEAVTNENNVYSEEITNAHTCTTINSNEFDDAADIDGTENIIEDGAENITCEVLGHALGIDPQILELTANLAETINPDITQDEKTNISCDFIKSCNNLSKQRKLKLRKHRNQQTQQ